MAAEVGYLDLGEFVYDNTMVLTIDDGPGGLAPAPFPASANVRLAVNGPFASVLGMFAINDSFDVHVRGGLLYADTRNRRHSIIANDPDTFVSVEAKDSTAEFFGGIGAT